MNRAGAAHINTVLLTILIVLEIFSFTYLVRSCLFLATFFSFSPFFLSFVSPLSSRNHFADIVVMEDSHASTPSASLSLRNGSLHYVMECISRYGHYLEGPQFSAMFIVGDQPSIYDRGFDIAIQQL